jgi:hypothetical protein
VPAVERRYLGGDGRSPRRRDLCRRRRLRWIESPDSDSQAERGFCAECGSSLFWRVSSRETISIAAGALDQPTGLTVARHVYVHERADYLWPHPPFEACDTAGGRA